MTVVGTATSGSLPASTPLSHRIEGGSAESAAGDSAPIIETTDEAHRMRAQAAKGARTVDGRAPNQGQNRRKMMEARHFPGLKCIYGARHIPLLAGSDLEP